MRLTRIAVLSAAIAVFGGAAWAAQEQAQQPEPQQEPAAESQPPAQVPEDETLPPALPLVASPAELGAYQEALNQPDPDQKITLAEKFLQDYPESNLRSHVYSALATAYQQKNDYDKVVENGEKSIALDPDNVMSLVMVAQVLPQRLGGSGLEMAQKLSRAERYATHGLELVDSLSLPANVLPEEFEKKKATLSSMLHSALGLVYLQRGAVGKAREEFEIAVSLGNPPDPTDYFRLGEAYRGERKYDEAIEAFEKAAELAPGTLINQLANEQVQKLKTVRDIMQR